MSSGFDRAAVSYDADFTDTPIGKLQRQSVYAILSEILDRKKPESILEINCGTGADAVWIANQGFNITATDISEGMIAIAKNKVNKNQPVFETMDIESLAAHFSGTAFDLVFSNFGGLNCLSGKAYATFFNDIHRILSPKGMLVLVIMPKNTLWEKIYFLSKGEFKNSFRRKNEFMIADVNGEKIPTFYYNPKETVTLAAAGFEVKNISPIGFFVPPSYLQPYFNRYPNILKVLAKFEKGIRNIGWLSSYSDHYCIVLEKK
ncbi:class I SAM-dependent methyltransferase [Flavobacterium pallidum]|uniref:Class I SAM-dependent methyltransferase n=1 Tax=Flavobacterium pallidum TaxID=2172098 RepID=A0A2S1SG30_9FLAO|nr:class I SAM-dependent methyltransferase [Flavobacterium pallidum]AWI25366.1 class I SAM-dependent methyltransferase [Flavobacterium pallidum]